MKTELYQTNPKKRKVIYWYFTKKPTIEQLQEQIAEWEIYIIEHTAFLTHPGLTPEYRCRNMIKTFKKELRIFKNKLKEAENNANKKNNNKF